MLKMSRIAGLAAIAFAAFIVASGLAALSSPAAADTPPAPAIAVAEGGCVVNISDVTGSAGMSPLPLAEHQNIDIDLSGDIGVSVACGTGRGPAATVQLKINTDSNTKGDLPAL